MSLAECVDHLIVCRKANICVLISVWIMHDVLFFLLYNFPFPPPLAKGAYFSLTYGRKLEVWPSQGRKGDP